MTSIDVEQAIRDHFPRLHRAALVLTGNPWDADDLAQETFLVLSRQADRFEGKSSLYTWLYGILLNLERRRRRRWGIYRRKLRVLGEDSRSHAATAPPAEAPVEVAEWKHSLWNFVAQLPDGQRHTLVLRFSEGMKYDEIAETLDCPLGTVKSRIYHGLAALRRLMKEEDESVRDLPRFPREDLTHVV